MNEGDTLGHYVLLEQLGRGGMGEVYKARDKRLERTVAIKLLPAERTSDTERKRRFIHEARSASALNHPNIVTIHDIASENGIDYIVMEYVPGATLDRAIPPGGLPVATAVRYAEQIARALAAAHEAGVIHRDLKPANVVVTPSGDIKVLDFGLAKLLRSSGGDRQTATESLTRAGVVVGTVHYMSPEQAAGTELDARSDVFSLGIILYEMLGGVRPFNGAHTAAILHAIYYETHAPLARPDVPDSLQEVLDRALEKDREKRPSSMAAIASDLRRIVRQMELGVTTTEERPAFPKKRRSARLPRRAALAGGCAAAAILLLAAAVRHRIPFLTPAVERTAASNPVPELIQEGRRLLDRADLPANVDRAVELMRAAIAADGASAPAHAGLALALVRKGSGGDRPDAGVLEEAKRQALRAVALDPQLAMARLALGCSHIAAREFGDAERDLSQALPLDPGNAELHRWMGEVHYRRREYDRAETSYRDAVRLRPDWFEGRMALAVLFYQTGRYKEAETEIMQALRLAPDSSYGYQTLGAMYHLQGRFEDAARAFQKSLEIRPSAPVYSNLGTIYFFRGMYAEAASAFRRAADLKPDVHLYWGNLGDAYRWWPGHNGEAPPAYDRAIALVRKALEARTDDSDLRSRLALYLAKRGDRNGALAELAAVGKAPGSKGSPLHYRVLVAYEAIGDRDSALRALEAALRARYSMEEIRKDPELARLREDPRFAAVVARAAR